VKTQGPLNELTCYLLREAGSQISSCSVMSVSVLSFSNAFQLSYNGLTVHTLAWQFLCCRSARQSHHIHLLS